ncbi:DUF4404 family protein [Allohahella marinimesophila]|uniref:DUF4404 family protein n=1 Tax=Allohahella marinimesophila TaxID=1054972 RepID=A0ABP7P9E5_9GAMM
MSIQNIRLLLNQLQDEIRTTDLDPETRRMIEDLEAEVQSVHDIDSDDSDRDMDGADTTQIAEQATLLETRFAAEHPTAERVMREIINTLARIGI